jgi:hypothetical protein
MAMTTVEGTAAGATPARPRSAWRTVAVPDEHGGWGLTLEPVLLGLLVAPSAAGVALGLAAFVAFVVRTPLKLVLVDRWRHRRLPRTTRAARVAAVELVVLAGLAAVAVARGGAAWVVPLALAAPLVGLELWFDMRSRSRRLVPELAGAVGMASTAAAIALAAGEGAALAAALWLVLAGRTVAAIPFVRVELDRWRRGTGSVATSDVAAVAGVAVAAVAVAVDDRVVAGAAAVGALALVQAVAVRRPPVPAKVLGIGQLVAGLAVVAAAALGVAVA